MIKRKTNKQQIRIIQQSRGSYHVNIPVDIIRSLNWKERQKVVVKKYGKDKVLITDWKTR